jgi:Fe-S-cluster containining protein
MSREHQLEDLRRKLEEAGRISEEDLAAQIREMGFACLSCGECCAGDDNSVVVYPFEIRHIMDFTGESWLDTVEPPSLGEWDSDGNFHTLEWRIKKCNGSCKFYSAKDRGCIAYEVRPLLCSTYPFYLDDGALRCSECRGIGGRIEPAQAERIAALLKERNIVEIREAIALLEKYEDFLRGSPGKGFCVVHDSEGEHRIGWDHLPGHRRVLNTSQLRHLQ